jgi:hypothetical protein
VQGGLADDGAVDDGGAVVVVDQLHAVEPG